MKILRGLHTKPLAIDASVATIGNFDGVHLGHQAILKRLSAEGRRRGVASVVITFEPLPHEYFAPQARVARLTSFRQRAQLIGECGIDCLLVLPFNANLAAMSASQFIREVLQAKLGVQYLVVGDDFRFGRDRAGDLSLLQSFDFETIATSTLLDAGERVSSTRLRKALATGDMAVAERLLGRPFSVSGRVAHGDKRGRTLGFPTANVHLKRIASPVLGVFAVEVLGLEGGPYFGAANLGHRPTFNGVRDQLEVNIFDFDGDIYGRQIDVVLRKRLRDEIRFDNFDALLAQIKQDVQNAQKFFNN